MKPALGAPAAMRVPLLAAALLLAGCVGGGEARPCEGTFEAPVSRIVDGDTLDVEGCDRVRLALVDTPERGEPGFAEASAFTAALCPVGSLATVDRDALQERDTTGTRIVAVVRCGGQNLNAELLAAGHAVVLREFCSRSEFADDPWAAEACA